jgi:hypothetical protein
VGTKCEIVEIIICKFCELFHLGNADVALS